MLGFNEAGLNKFGKEVRAFIVGLFGFAVCGSGLLTMLVYFWQGLIIAFIGGIIIYSIIKKERKIK